MESISVVGAGNMGGAIIKGIIKSEALDPSFINVYDIDPEVISEFKEMGVIACESASKCASGTDMVIIAIKPHLVENILNEIKSSLGSNTIILSIAAGISTDDINKITGPSNPIVLCMPNTGILNLQSSTCISSNNADEDTINEIRNLFNKMGITFVIDEKLMPAATAISGCGPAFVNRFIRSFMQAGVEMGFKPEIAKSMANQVIKGTAVTLQSNGNHPEDEIDKVTTPAGITITGLNEMEHNGFSSSVIKGLIKAFNKVNPNM